jgi:5'-deoxynucleotidase YfbR-like HD superfamily hydrolase
VSVESRLVKAADKLDLLMQSREYEKGGARSLQEFWDTADSDFAGLGVDDLISDLIEELKNSRKKDLEG